MLDKTKGAGGHQNTSLTDLATENSSPVSHVLKVFSCLALLLFSVAATLFTEASKSGDGTYSYNTFLIPLTVEATKMTASVVLLVVLRMNGRDHPISFAPKKFASFSLPALCYFVSNNCMFYIIKELGPTTFQLTNNLKVLTTGVLMRVFLGRKLTWIRWKALLLLVIGSTVTQLRTDSSFPHGSRLGFVYVVINSFAAGAGGVLSELLLKGREQSTAVDSIHWQNIQLYFFGMLFGMLSLVSSSTTNQVGHTTLYEGFNNWAYATVASLTVCGLLVSFILKYLDNFAKCFVAALSILFVAVIHSAVEREALELKLILGVVLTCMAIEQYNLPQS